MCHNHPTFVAMTVTSAVITELGVSHSGSLIQLSGSWCWLALSWDPSHAIGQNTNMGFAVCPGIHHGSSKSKCSKCVLFMTYARMSHSVTSANFFCEEWITKTSSYTRGREIRLDGWDVKKLKDLFDDCHIKEEKEEVAGQIWETHVSWRWYKFSVASSGCKRRKNETQFIYCRRGFGKWATEIPLCHLYMNHKTSWHEKCYLFTNGVVSSFFIKQADCVSTEIPSLHQEKYGCGVFSYTPMLW